MATKNLNLFINGAFTPARSGRAEVSVNPANGEPVARFAWAGAADAADAVGAAREAFDSGPWREMGNEERKALLHRLSAALKERAEDFAFAEVADAGALINKARGDVALCVKNLKYFGDMAGSFDWTPKPVEGAQRPGRSFLYTVREPIGVCAQIIPWNFPLTMAVWKLGPALATSNTVVLKCAPETPVSALMLAELVADAGFPPGVVNIITGDREAGEAMVTDARVDKVAFTGSTETGRHLMALAAGTMKKVTLECGGKSANIVLPDADPELAIDGSLYATFFHSGQVCASGTRLLLPRELEEDFVARMVERVAGMRVGDPMDPETTVGPVVSKRQLDRVLDYIDIGRQEGATVAAGGARATEGALSRGYFVQPTIFTGVRNDMRIAQEEIFGPVLCVLDYDSVDDAVRIANDSQYGLAGGVWSADVEAAKRVAARMRTGWVWINEWHLIPETAAFGGYKQSGIGRELGEHGLHEYTEMKTLYVDDSGQRDAKFWYDVVLPRRKETGAREQGT